MTAALAALPRTHAFILAGGQGERLLPLTLSLPKPLIHFGGAFRIVDFTLSNCLSSRLNNVCVLTQHRSEDVHAYIRNIWMELWNAVNRGRGGCLQCLPPVNGKRYRGTADAVFHNLPILEFSRPESVLILSGDHIYDMDYRRLVQHHAATGADLTIAVVEHPLEQAGQFGVVEVDCNSHVSRFEEKPSNPRPLPGRSTALISMGVYVFKTDVLIEAVLEHCGFAGRYDFGRDIIPALVESARVSAFDFRDETLDGPGYWRDVGTVDSYYRASMDLVYPRRRFDPYKSAWPLRQGCSQKGPAVVCGTASVVESVLSPRVRIEEGASVEKCVLLPGVRIGRGVRLRRTVVNENAILPDGFEAGFHLDRDRSHHAVTDAGVVVVTNTANEGRSPVAQCEPVIRLLPNRGHKKAVAAIDHI